MTYDVQRWDVLIQGSTVQMTRQHYGLYVLAADAEAHEKAAALAAVRECIDRYPFNVHRVREQVVRDCIAAVLSVGVRHWPYDETSDTYAEFIPVGSAVDAVRALLEGVEP